MVHGQPLKQSLASLVLDAMNGLLVTVISVKNPSFYEADAVYKFCIVQVRILRVVDGEGLTYLACCMDRWQ